jgi:hypothetical protein
MNNFKTHEDAVDLTEKYSAYQLAKMLLEAQEELEDLQDSVTEGVRE